MDSYLKKRLAIFLCLLLTVPTIMSALPQAKLEVHAASAVDWNGTGELYQMDKKTQGFYIGDGVVIYVGDVRYGRLSMLQGVSYKSSNPAVAAVDSKTGLVKPKKTGKATITMKFKKSSATITVEVVKDLGENPAENNFTALEDASKKLVKAYGKGISKANRYNVKNAVNVYAQIRENISYGNINPYDGIEILFDSATQKYTNKVRFPILSRAAAIEDAMDLMYTGKLNPIGTGGAKLFEVRGVTGKGSSVTVKLSKKVSDGQIFAIKAAVSDVFDSKIIKNKTAVFPLYLQDRKTGHRYYALATATQGKNTLSVRLKSGRLKKRASYKLVGMNRYDVMTSKWTDKGKTVFKAK